MFGEQCIYNVDSHFYNRLGECNGELIGGNLALLAHSIGSVSEPNTKNKILFIEDVGEFLYNTDRMLHQLKRAGWFIGLRGLLIGSFSDMKDTTIPFGKTIYEIIWEAISAYNFPVAFNFPVGHQPENYALKCGALHQLEVKKDIVTLQEIV
jgi:muramoyltetrapeptide carboxypeptidase